MGNPVPYASTLVLFSFITHYISSVKESYFLIHLSSQSTTIHQRHRYHRRWRARFSALNSQCLRRSVRTKLLLLLCHRTKKTMTRYKVIKITTKKPMTAAATVRVFIEIPCLYMCTDLFVYILFVFTQNFQR